ncbi:MAG: DUF2062 domain-containing protein [Planctomycetes bacterium]|nr:DUF2062 domain-containing protein [Planctomycetota bacterium]
MRHSIYRACRGILAIKDRPQRIAWGVAIGTFVAYLPIVGVQMIVGAIICKIFKANILASLPLAWITNPVTVGPIYYLLFLLGGVFTGDTMTYVEMEGIVAEIAEAGIFSVDGLETTITLFAKIFWPTFIGGAIFGLCNAVIFYFMTLKFVLHYQKRRSDRKSKWKRITEQINMSNVKHNGQPPQKVDESLAKHVKDGQNRSDENHEQTDFPIS